MDGLVVGEAILVNTAVNQLTKIAVRRPRPLLYDSPTKAELDNADNYRSFYSQHTSLTFAAGLSYARTFALRHPQSRYRWLGYTAAVGAGMAAGTLRVLSGKHFPTDVLTGAAAGTAAGLAVPWLHPKRNATRVTVLPTRSGMTMSLRVPIG